MESGSPASRHQDHGHTTNPIPPPNSLNGLAWSATVHCFTGCAIGEVLGMVLATAFRLGFYGDYSCLGRPRIRLWLWLHVDPAPEERNGL